MLSIKTKGEINNLPDPGVKKVIYSICFSAQYEDLTRGELSTNLKPF